MRAQVVDNVLAKSADPNKSFVEQLLACGWFVCEAVPYIIGVVPVGLFWEQISNSYLEMRTQNRVLIETTQALADANL
jgi:hypothetical protein